MTANVELIGFFIFFYFGKLPVEMLKFRAYTGVSKKNQNDDPHSLTTRL